MKQLGNNFEYTWVIRCSGTRANRNIEYGTVSKAPSKGITPLLEVIDTTLFSPFAHILREKYGKLLVDFPHYLLEANNKFSDDMRILKSDYPTPESFFQTNKASIDIPVISAPHIGFGDFDDENKTLQNLKGIFEKFAVRVRVPTYDLSGTTNVLKSFRTLLDNMSVEDFLFLDVFNFSGSESNIDQNVQLMAGLGKNHGLTVSILNAFEPTNGSHNYGPLLSYKYTLNGFGDFATEKRFPSTGGPGENKIIRYYDWMRYVLREYKERQYSAAALTLRSSNCWKNNFAHVSDCCACKDASTTENQGHSYWKSFRMLHYLNSIANETQLKYNSVASDQDLDPDGYDTLFNVGRT